MSVLATIKNVVRRRPVQLSMEDYIAKLRAKGLNQDGTPILNPVPIAPPIGYKKHPSMVEVVRDMIRSEKLAQAARDAGHETFEEAEDFDVGDDPDQLRSPFENEHDPDLGEILKAGAEVIRERKRKQLEEAGTAPRSAAASPPRKPSQDPPADGPAPSEADDE